MWKIGIFIWFILTNLSLSLSNICSINIDEFINKTYIDTRDSLTSINTIDINDFVSSWEEKTIVDDDNDHHQYSNVFNIIQIYFTIPYELTNDSILNQTIFIIDALQNQIIVSSSNICRNDSLFYLNYSTSQPLPQHVCLYLLLNLSISINRNEILFCRTIDNLSTNITNIEIEDSQTVGPSGYFILSQSIIIFIMMFIIYAVQTAREKKFADRLHQRWIQSRIYKIIFGTPASVRSSNAILDSATTLQAGLSQINFHRNLIVGSPHQNTTPIEEQVLGASDLTTTVNERRLTRPFINRDLIDVKEFTKKMSITNESTTDTGFDV